MLLFKKKSIFFSFTKAFYEDSTYSVARQQISTPPLHLGAILSQANQVAWQLSILIPCSLLIQREQQLRPQDIRSPLRMVSSPFAFHLVYTQYMAHYEKCNICLSTHNKHANLGSFQSTYLCRWVVFGTRDTNSQLKVFKKLCTFSRQLLRVGIPTPYE